MPDNEATLLFNLNKSSTLTSRDVLKHLTFHLCTSRRQTLLLEKALWTLFNAYKRKVGSVLFRQYLVTQAVWRRIIIMQRITLLVGLVLTLSLHRTVHAADPAFRDVTPDVRIDTSSGKIKKFGSPAVADLDRDGLPDLLFCHHDTTFTELYFNSPGGTFTKAPWGIHHDSHGLVPFPISLWHKSMRFILSVGGNNGETPNHPLMFQVDTSRVVSEVSVQAGIDKAGGRGRSAAFLDLSMGAHPYWPDVIFTNAHALQGPSQYAYENTGQQRFTLRTLNGGFENTRNGLITVTDLETDGVMEVVSFPILQIWKVTAPFHMIDISNQVLPPGMNRGAVAAVAEIDYDNDGDFDIYLARAWLGTWMTPGIYEDILLENRNGKYYDVSASAKIPRGTVSHGVTTADFDNDGYMDIHVTQYTGSDLFLMNNGDGTFRTVRDVIVHDDSTRGDNAVAVDYDMDGKVDLIMSEGDKDEISLGGTFHVLKNSMSDSSVGNFIHIRVGHPWDRSCTPLNARIFVKSGTLAVTRRVGSPGTSVSTSYLETVHVGLGDRTMADVIYVRYTNGYVVERRNVSHGQTVVLGLL